LFRYLSIGSNEDVLAELERMRKELARKDENELHLFSVYFVSFAVNFVFVAANFVFFAVDFVFLP